MAIDIDDFNPRGYPASSQIKPGTLAVVNTDLPYAPHWSEGTVVKILSWARGSISLVHGPANAVVQGPVEIHNYHLNHNEL